MHLISHTFPLISLPSFTPTVNKTYSDDLESELHSLPCRPKFTGDQALGWIFVFPLTLMPDIGDKYQ